MRKLFAALLLLAFGVAVAPANQARAEETEKFKLRNANISKEMRATRASRLSTSATLSDTVYVGGGGTVTAANPWGIEAVPGNPPAASGKPASSPAHKGGVIPGRGMWDFETAVNGDSAQGWTPFRTIFFSFGSGRNDRVRPETAMDIGNNVNLGVANMTGTEAERRRTPGVIGLWHVDAGSTVGGAAAPDWAPLQGTKSAWMGLRRIGDVSHVDPITGNPFNEAVAKYSHFDFSGGTLPQQSGFPGYLQNLDQLLYKDITAVGGEDLTISFQWQTNMSTNLSLTSDNTRTGWFTLDWLAAPDDGFGTATQVGNFVSGIDAGVADAPVDSFMVYIGAPVDDNSCYYTASYPEAPANPRPVYDKQRRWFSEIINIGDPLSAPGGPPTWNKGVLWQQLLSKAGNGSGTETVTIPAARIATMSAGSGKVRLVFRVKTNRGGDDQTAISYNSKGGAAVVDNVTYSWSGAGGSNPAGWGTFENNSDIDNAVGVDPLNKWKSTGKPPRAYAHVENQNNPDIIALYRDICGAFGTSGRIADIGGNFISFGDHDNAEHHSGPIFGTADFERNATIISPTIDLTPAGSIAAGLPAGYDLVASREYLYDRELYAGDMNVFASGHLWRLGAQVFPLNTEATLKGGYKAWSPIRTVHFSYFNPDKQAFRILDDMVVNSLWNNSNDTEAEAMPPDSARVFEMHRTLCYNFGITTDCVQDKDGFLLDNVSLTLVDGDREPPLLIEIWHWNADAFPANEDDGVIVGGDPAKFDTCAAYVKTGLNIAPTNPGCCPSPRFSVPGDSTEIRAPGANVRVDMVFRILPGPGNYVNIGHPEMAPIGQLRKVPTSVTPAVANAVSDNFWESFLGDNGENGTPGGHPGGVWDPNVWNSARCDSEEINFFPYSGRIIEILPPTVQYMSTYHEADPKYTSLGIPKERCFVRGPTAAISDMNCGGGTPPQIPDPDPWPPTYLDELGPCPGPRCTGLADEGIPGKLRGWTREYTKILPDGQFTPGTHVQYFFRKAKASTNDLILTAPDTNTVFPQPVEMSTDAHRWQQFSVLPDRWKDASYVHPVTGQPGLGQACLLVLDYNDRRGNERVWVGVADTVGATAPARRGAHNGWAAPGTGTPAVNDPANFVRAHLGQPGTSWDFWQKKASESLTTGNGLGDRLGKRDAANPQINGKAGRQGPTPKMLSTFYSLIFMMSGDISSVTLTPIENNSADDVALLDGFLRAGGPRGFWAMGEGWAKSNNDAGPLQLDFMNNTLGVELREDNYGLAFGDGATVADLIPLGIDTVSTGILGVRNTCLLLNDVLNIAAGPLAGGMTVLSKYQDQIVFGEPLPFISGLYKPANITGGSDPWVSVVDGWDIESLRSRFDVDTKGRHRYFYQVFTDLFASICKATGSPIIPPDVPILDDGRMFFALGNNPVTSGQARFHFGLSKADRVQAKVYDVSGRLIRTLADRTFAAGRHELVWDGLDNAGHRVERGVYFTQVKYLNAKFIGAKKLIVLN